MKHKKKKLDWKRYLNSFKSADKRLLFSAMIDLAFIAGVFVFGFFMQFFFRKTISEFSTSFFMGASTLTATGTPSPAAMSSLNSGLSSQSALVIKLLFFIVSFFLLIFLLWVITRGFIWQIFLKKKWNFKTWAKFSLVTIIWGLICAVPLLFISFISGSFLLSLAPPGIFLQSFIAIFYFLLLFVFLILYLHFSSILYYIFTVKQQIKAVFLAYKTGVMKIKLFLKPLLFIFLTFIVLSIASTVLNILPEVLKTSIATIIWFLTLSWVRWYYISIFKSHKNLI